MKKAWIVFALILIIAGQLVALSLFHEVDTNGFSPNNAVITVAKWNYVDAYVTLEIMPMVRNGSSNVEVILANGTSFNLTSTNGAMPELYTQRFSYPRTGQIYGNEELQAPQFSLSTDKPFAITVASNVTDVSGYISSVAAMAKSQNIDVYSFVVYGEAAISVNGYGVTV